MINEGDILSVLKKLQNLGIPHRVDDLLDLFNDDAQFQIVGHSTLLGKQEIRNAFEYDAAANTELRFINFVPRQDGLTCQLVAQNDRLKAMGVDEVLYTSCMVSLKDGRIQRFVATVEGEASRRIKERMQAFVSWLARQHPAEFSRMCTPEGEVIYSAETGRLGIPFIREWWAGVKKG